MQEFGPRPARHPPQITAAQMKVLRAVAALGGQDLRHAEIADAVGGHPNAVRPHLEALVQGNLLGKGEVRDGHRGRPPSIYSLTEHGKSAIAEPPVGDGSALVGALTSFMLSVGHGPEDALRVGRIWAEALQVVDPRAPSSGESPEAHTVDDGAASTVQGLRPISVDRVVDVMETLGFEPDLESTPDGHTVTLKACPMLSLAQHNPEFICRIHEGLIEGVLEREGNPSSVEMKPFAAPQACLVHIRPRSED